MNAPLKTDYWVGIKPLKSIMMVSQIKPLKPRLYLAKIYESLEVVLASLWSHQLRHEISEVGTLILSEEGALYSYFLEQKSGGHFRSNDTQRMAKAYLAERDAHQYPGHSLLCLFLIARARDNVEMRLASDLCESITECLLLIENHLNQDGSLAAVDEDVIKKLVTRWKQAFPFSE